MFWNLLIFLEVDATATEFVIRDLEPATTYNVTLKPKDQNDIAWGAVSGFLNLFFPFISYI